MRVPVGRRYFMVLAFVSLWTVVYFSPRSRAVATTSPTHLPCTSNVVVDYNADPSGTTDSTLAFIKALNAAPGPNIVCVPPGTYSIGSPPSSSPTAIPHDLTITDATSSGGGGLIGPDQGVATIVQQDLNSYILDSCPTAKVDASEMRVPLVCPAEMDANDVLGGWTFANLSLRYASQVPEPTPGATSGPLNGWASSAIYFPKMNGVEFHNISINNAWNCYDLAAQNEALSQVEILENSSINSCAGHFIALHFSAGEFSVVRQKVDGGVGSGGTENVFHGTMLDTTMVNGGTLSALNFLQNDWEDGAWGTLGLISNSTQFGDTTMNGNICDNFTLGCYFFFAVPNQANPGITSHITISDKNNTSWYSPLQFDGGSYSTAGVHSIQVNGGNFGGGRSPGTATSVFWITGTPASGGFSVDGSSITLQFPYGVPTPWSYTYTTAPTQETPRTVAQHIVAAVGCHLQPSSCNNLSGPPNGVYAGEPMIGTSYMANPYLAPIEMMLVSPPPGGTYTAQPYTVITTGALSVVNQQQATSPTCALPTSIPTGSGTPTPFPTNSAVMTPAPCWTGYFDQGDGVAFLNRAQDIQIANAQLQSNSQAALHILNAGNDVHITGNVMGFSNSVASYDCVNVGTTAIPNLQIVGNDCTGVTHVPIVYTSPYPMAMPSFWPVIRSNRGAQGFTFVPSGAGTTTLNLGPFDCTYYIDYNGSTGISLTITYPNSTGQTVNPPPTSIFLPVGASYTLTFSTGTPTSSALCLP